MIKFLILLILIGLPIIAINMIAPYTNSTAAELLASLCWGALIGHVLYTEH